MKAYLIDPEHRTIESVQVSDDIKDICEAIQAECFDIAHLEHGDGIYVDDEGLRTGGHYFGVMDAECLFPVHPCLAGRGLVLGCDSQGDSVSPKITLEQLQRRIVWLSQERGQLIARLLGVPGIVRSFNSYAEMIDYIECIKGKR